MKTVIFTQQEINLTLAALTLFDDYCKQTPEYWNRLPEISNLKRKLNN